MREPSVYHFLLLCHSVFILTLSSCQILILVMEGETHWFYLVSSFLASQMYQIQIAASHHF